MSEPGVPPGTIAAAASVPPPPLAYEAPVHSRVPVSLFRLIQFCWAAPLLDGIPVSGEAGAYLEAMLGSGNNGIVTFDASGASAKVLP